MIVLTLKLSFDANFSILDVCWGPGYASDWSEKRLGPDFLSEVVLCEITLKKELLRTKISSKFLIVLI